MYKCSKFYPTLNYLTLPYFQGANLNFFDLSKSNKKFMGLGLNHGSKGLNVRHLKFTELKKR